MADNGMKCVVVNDISPGCLRTDNLLELISQCQDFHVKCSKEGNISMMLLTFWSETDRQAFVDNRQHFLSDSVTMQLIETKQHLEFIRDKMKEDQVLVREGYHYMERTLMVEPIASSMTTAEMYQLFPGALYVFFVKDGQGGTAESYGYIEYASTEKAMAAAAEWEGKTPGKFQRVIQYAKISQSIAEGDQSKQAGLRPWPVAQNIGIGKMGNESKKQFSPIMEESAMADSHASEAMETDDGDEEVGGVMLDCVFCAATVDEGQLEHHLHEECAGYQCKSCGVIFATGHQQLAEHKQNCLGPIMESSQVPCPMPDCPEKGSYDYIKKHYISCSYKLLWCYECIQVFRKFELDEHDCVIKKSPPSIICNYCLQIFPSQEQSQNHQKDCKERICHYCQTKKKKVPTATLR